MRIPLSSVSLSERERAYVNEALDSGYVSGIGAFVDRFEAALRERLRRRYAIAVNSGSSALELALLALNVGPGDEVIVPALTFASPAAAVMAVGATPVLADVEERSWTLDPDTASNLVGPRTKALIAVDVLGHPCDYDALSTLGIPIIEDAAEAHGAAYGGRPAGGLGDISILSFHANKAISTGEGGCVTTDDRHLAETVRLIANHGMTPGRRYWHDVAGRNHRMTNLVAALGVAQMERWTDLIDGRNRVDAIYRSGLAGMPVMPRPVAPWADAVCWLFSMVVGDREELLADLRTRDIDARAIWTPLPDLPLYRGSVRRPCPVAARLGETVAWLPTWSDMPTAAAREVVTAIVGHYRGAAPFAPVPPKAIGGESVIRQ